MPPERRSSEPLKLVPSPDVRKKREAIGKRKKKALAGHGRSPAVKVWTFGRHECRRHSVQASRVVTVPRRRLFSSIQKFSARARRSARCACCGSCVRKAFRFTCMRRCFRCHRSVPWRVSTTRVGTQVFLAVKMLDCGFLGELFLAKSHMSIMLISNGVWTCLRVKCCSNYRRVWTCFSEFSLLEESSLRPLWFPQKKLFNKRLHITYLTLLHDGSLLIPLDAFVVDSSPFDMVPCF